MSKVRTVYVCQECGISVPNWAGQCPSCKQWNTLVETLDYKTSFAGTTASAKGGAKQSAKNLTDLKIDSLNKIKASSNKRLPSGISEFDRVLGGGFVPGQVVLLAGEPGIGKSTLVTQVCKSLVDNKILYVCGEESPSQIKLRAERMGYEGSNIYMLQNTDPQIIGNLLYSNKEFQYLVVDSVQTLQTMDLLSAPGSAAQIKECAQRIVRFAKELSVCVILIGHVTKEGEIAGPKILEHIVDTVLYMEGDSQHLYRMLRTTKNRFGPISEVGLFEITESGMREVANPSEVFISSRDKIMIGSCIAVAMEGFRPILYEVQALAVKTSFGYPKRTSNGFNVNRLQVLIAVLEKRCNIPCYQYDIYLNIAGGFKISDTACDLAVCVALASAVLEKPIKSNTALFGEVGLLGEIRAVPHEAKRAKEAKRLGYKTLDSPKWVKECLLALGIL